MVALIETNLNNSDMADDGDDRISKIRGPLHCCRTPRYTLGRTERSRLRRLRDEGLGCC